MRRVLANIPSYMIFDDHEVTDDWNMTFSTWKKIYHDPLGMRIIQNALTAYALCQHWGNTPEQFDPSACREPAGAQLLEKFSGINADLYDNRSERIRELVGLFEPDDFKSKKAAVHKPGALNYHFTVEGPGHQSYLLTAGAGAAFRQAGRPSSRRNK